jgi:tRNA(Ile)-lysidine synthase
VSAADETPLAAVEGRALFADLADIPVLILAVSGGPDSTALLVLAARWCAARKAGPKLVAVTVDHALRPESKREAGTVKRLARSLGIEHRTLRWTGVKPKTGLQEAAREARYRLLAGAARKAGARHVLTAHTLDDQAETILFRMARGSGLLGLTGMMPESPVPVIGAAGIMLVRPLLTVPKSRLLETLRAAQIPYTTDPSNSDPRFTRPRIRALMPQLAKEGLTARRLALLGRRAERAEQALMHMAVVSVKRLAAVWPPSESVQIQAAGFLELPEEVATRVLYCAIASIGHDAPLQLGKLEALGSKLRGAAASRRFRCTLAGAMITLKDEVLTVERAPARRRAPKRP